MSGFRDKSSSKPTGIANVPIVEKTSNFKGETYTNHKGTIVLPNGDSIAVELSADSKNSVDKKGRPIIGWLKCAYFKKSAQPMQPKSYGRKGW
ncbi:MAG: hypothetical protein FADNKDHG_01466 [Holosporales bacterium]